MFRCEHRQSVGSPQENLCTVANVVTLLRLTIATALFSVSAYLSDPRLNLAGLAVYWAGDVWSPLGKVCNTGLVTLLLLVTKSNLVVLPVVIVLVAVKLYSCALVLRLREPTVRLREPRPSKIPLSRRPRLAGDHK